VNQGWIYQDRVQTDGETLLEFYVRRYRHSDGATWAERIDQGQIRWNGQLAQPAQILSRGDQLTYQRPPWSEPTVPLDFTILHEDPDLWVIVKPSGLPVLPGGGFVEHTLLGQLRLRYPTDTPLPIHRLGRGTSGLMVLARTSQARAHLSAQLRHSQMEKIYRALVVGHPPSDSFSIATPIGPVPHPRLGQIHAHSLSGRPALSQVHVLERRTTTSLLAVQIPTGRPHQIRIHLASIGHPLWHDPLYQNGGLPHPEHTPGDLGYLLHAHQLRLIHPTTGAALGFESPPPPLLEVGENNALQKFAN